MSINPETDLDLEKLFLPAWAQEASDTNRYAKFTGNEGAPRERRGDDRRGPRPPRPDGGGERRGFGGPRRDGQNRGPGGPRHEGGFGGPHRDDRGPRRDDRGGFRGERRDAPPPLPPIVPFIVPDEKGVESLARQIKMTGRAFPLFDIAHLILQKPERYALRFSTKKNAEGQVLQPLFLCALDDTLWLSEDEAVGHVLQKHFATFYQADKTATEPPKGVYTFVGQCGMSGVILGPPNFHDYQNKLRKLHADRFGRMPFEMFKSRVKIVRDEAVVKQWVEEQSWKVEYSCLNVPEPLKLQSREEVETHFRATHKDTIIKAVESHTVSGVAARGLHGGLGRVVQDILAQQRRFPMQIATTLSQAFANHGLQFFKVNKTVTHVSVARPHFLNLETTIVSDAVKKIVEFINGKPKCNRRQLIEALAPSPLPAPIPVVPAAEGEAAPATTAPVAPEPTTEQTAIIADLHWLVHQGHVIEFANGTLETAKKPLPRPPKPEKKPAQASAAADTASESPAEPPTSPEEAAAPPAETPAASEATGEISQTEKGTEAAGVESTPEPAPGSDAPPASGTTAGEIPADAAPAAEEKPSPATG